MTTETLVKAPGAFLEMEHSEYLKGGIGHSDMVRLLKSPAHYKWAKDNPSDPTPAMAFGSAVHTAILEPQRFKQEYVVKPVFDRRTKVGKEESAAWDEAHKGVSCITQDEMNALQGMMTQVASHATAAAMLRRSRRELSYFWDDPETGIRCRMRPDATVLAEDGRVEAIIDVKTTRDASRDGFARQIANLGYDVQDALYVDGVNHATGGGNVPFFFLAVENTAPYGVALYRAGSRTYEVGRSKYRAALELYAWCKKTDRWPSYQLDGAEEIEIPGWARGVDEV